MERFQSFIVITIFYSFATLLQTPVFGFNATSKASLVEKSFKYYDVPDSKMDQYQMQVEVNISGGILGADGNTRALYFVLPAGFGVNINQRYTTQMMSKNEKTIFNYTNKNSICTDCPQSYCESCTDAFARVMPIDNGYGHNIENRIIKFEPLTSDANIEDINGNGRRISRWIITITFEADESFRFASRKLYITGMEQEDIKEVLLTDFETSFLPNGNLEAIDIVESFYGTNVVGGETNWKYVYPIDLAKPIKVSNLFSADLMSFDGIQDDGSTILSWNTGNECRNEKFVIERSKDGLIFETVGEIKGCDNMIEKREYAFIDANRYERSNYYRFYVKDTDDSRYYSKTIKVNVENNSVANVKASIADKNLEWTTLSNADSKQPMTIAIFDKAGKLIKTITPDALGINKNSINLEGFKNNGHMALFKYQNQFKAVKMDDK